MLSGALLYLRLKEFLMTKKLFRGFDSRTKGNHRNTIMQKRNYTTEANIESNNTGLGVNYIPFEMIFT